MCSVVTATLPEKLSLIQRRSQLREQVEEPFRRKASLERGQCLSPNLDNLLSYVLDQKWVMGLGREGNVLIRKGLCMYQPYNVHNGNTWEGYKFTPRSSFVKTFQFWLKPHHCALCLESKDLMHEIPHPDDLTFESPPV